MVNNRLRVVSNFGDGDCGAGEIQTLERAKFRGDATRRERRKLETTDKGREFELLHDSSSNYHAMSISELLFPFFFLIRNLTFSNLPVEHH